MKVHKEFQAKGPYSKTQNPLFQISPLSPLSKFSMADKKLGFFESFMLSGAAAGVSKTAAAPIERVKLLVQNQDEMIKQVKRLQ